MKLPNPRHATPTVHEIKHRSCLLARHQTSAVMLSSAVRWKRSGVRCFRADPIKKKVVLVFAFLRMQIGNSAWLTLQKRWNYEGVAVGTKMWRGLLLEQKCEDRTATTQLVVKSTGISIWLNIKCPLRSHRAQFVATKVSKEPVPCQLLEECECSLWNE